MKYPLLIAAIAAFTLSACQKPADTPAPIEVPAAAAEVPMPAPVPAPNPASEAGQPSPAGTSGMAGDTEKQSMPSETIIVAPENK
jgi:hypothetical protein